MSLLKNYMEQEIQLNGHNKQEYPPMHTAEHILNQTMIRRMHRRILLFVVAVELYFLFHIVF